MKIKNHLKILTCCLVSLMATPLISYAEANQSLFSRIMNQQEKGVLLVSVGKQISKQITENNSSLNYSINIRYPQIITVNSNKAAEHFNQAVLTIIHQQMDAFKKRIKNTEGNSNLPKAENYLKINYEDAGAVSQSRHTDYANERFAVESYVRGDAHPTHQIITFNYDINNDKPLALADLFKPGSNYLNVIANYCTQQLLAKKLPADFIKSGTAAKSDNYQTWGADNSGNLVITFNEGQVAPNVYGPQEVVIPGTVLKDIATQDANCTYFTPVQCDGT